MTRRILADCATIGILIGLGRSTAAAQCRAADAQTVNMIRYVTRLVTAPDSNADYAPTRQAYHLPVVSAKQVTLVSTPKICNSALHAYARLLPAGTPALTSVYVVAVGNVYVVWTPAAPGTEGTLNVVFDSRFKKLESWAA